MKNPDLRIIVSAGPASFAAVEFINICILQTPHCLGQEQFVLGAQRPLGWQREQGQNALVLTWISELWNAPNFPEFGVSAEELGRELCRVGWNRMGRFPAGLFQDSGAQALLCHLDFCHCKPASCLAQIPALLSSLTPWKHLRFCWGSKEVKGGFSCAALQFDFNNQSHGNFKPSRFCILRGVQCWEGQRGLWCWGKGGGQKTGEKVKCLITSIKLQYLMAKPAAGRTRFCFLKNNLREASNHKPTENSKWCYCPGGTAQNTQPPGIYLLSSNHTVWEQQN